MNKKKVNIFRVMYRIKSDTIKEPFVSELIIKSSKEEKEINFEEAIKNYWKKNNANLFFFDSISIIEKIGEE